LEYQKILATNIFISSEIVGALKNALGPCGKLHVLSAALFKYNYSLTSIALTVWLSPHNETVDGLGLWGHVQEAGTAGRCTHLTMIYLTLVPCSLQGIDVHSQSPCWAIKDQNNFCRNPFSYTILFLSEIVCLPRPDLSVLCQAFKIFIYSKFDKSLCLQMAHKTCHLPL
jgi:hypothetical protein